MIRRTEDHFKLPPGTITNAMTFLMVRKKAGELPGFSRDDRASASIYSSSFHASDDGTYPLKLTLSVQKLAERTWYDFTVTQSVEAQPGNLKLRNASVPIDARRKIFRLPIPAERLNRALPVLASNEGFASLSNRLE